MKLETLGGEHIKEVCAKAVALADQQKEPVEFEFNGTSVVVKPGELPEDVVSRWRKDYEENRQKYLNSKEYKDAEKKREKEYKDRCNAHLKETAKTESELRETKTPHPCTLKQLNEYVESLIEREHDYGTCVYAMSLAAVAAFNLVAHKLGVTGFQASCADLDLIRRTRSIKGPFILLKAEDALYPQLNLRTKLNEALKEWEPWLKERAQELLKEKSQFHPHPEVTRHWHELAER